MEHAGGVSDLALEIARLKDENGNLKSELRVTKRDLSHLQRKVHMMENNYNVKMSMFRRLADESEKQKRFLVHVLKNSINFIILIDDKLNVAYCSSLFLNKIGVIYNDKVQGKHLLDVYGLFANGELFELIKCDFETAVKNFKTTHLDVIADIGGGGERVYRVTHMPMLDGQNLHGVFINWSDNTDMVSARIEAEEANRSKSKFLAVMSHEIRTPMNAIIGITQMHLQKGGLSDEYAKALDKIYTSGTNLLGIINEILDMSKLETGKLELFPAEYCVPSLINDSVHTNIVQIGSKPIEFILDVDENLPLRFYGDELRLRQILNNLLSNAIKYTEKGQINFSISHSPDGEYAKLRFAVKDTGQGIKPEDQERLFSEYHRFNPEANRATVGTGLGLNITKRLVSMMDGTIEVESDYGKGSTFTVTIKQKAIECKAIGPELAKQLCRFTFKDDRLSAKLQITQEPMPYGSVLVVDDIDTNLYVAEGLLSSYKLKVETVTSGFRAIEKVESGNIYDVIFMDHMMPQMDGIETTQKLRALGYKGSIVALTANALAGNDVMFSQNGFDGFISKPIDVPHLNDVLNKFVRDQHPEEAAKFKPETVAQTDEITPRLLSIFCRDAEKAVVTLRETVADSDIKLFTTTAHAMKSALANIREDESSKLASALENAGNSRDMEFIAANTESFIELLEALVKKLTPADADSKNNADVTEDANCLTEQLLIMRTACEGYDNATAYAALDLLEEKPWKPSTAAALEEIRDMLFLYSDFEEAEKLILRLLNRQQV